MWWSSSFDMMHCAITQMSGVRFPVAAGIAFLHPLAVMLNYLARFGEINVYDGLDQFGLLYVCIFCCLLVAYRREHIERKEFVAFLNTSFDKRMREKLLNEMLPQKIKDALQYGGDIIEEDVRVIKETIEGHERRESGKEGSMFQKTELLTNNENDSNYTSLETTNLERRTSENNSWEPIKLSSRNSFIGGSRSAVLSKNEEYLPSSPRISNAKELKEDDNQITSFVSNTDSPRQSIIRNSQSSSPSQSILQRDKESVNNSSSSSSASSSFIIPGNQSLSSNSVRRRTPILTPLTNDGQTSLDFSNASTIGNGMGVLPIDLQQQQQQQQSRTRSIHFPKRSSVSLPFGVTSIFWRNSCSSSYC